MIDSRRYDRGERGGGGPRSPRPSGSPTHCRFAPGRSRSSAPPAVVAGRNRGPAADYCAVRPVNTRRWDRTSSGIASSSRGLLTTGAAVTAGCTGLRSGPEPREPNGTETAAGQPSESGADDPSPAGAGTRPRHSRNTVIRWRPRNSGGLRRECRRGNRREPPVRRRRRRGARARRSEIYVI